MKIFFTLAVTALALTVPFSRGNPARASNIRLKPIVLTDLVKVFG
ncbi:MAG: hypothetical protein AAB538_02865 [Patescibacteria group bacterium]